MTEMKQNATPQTVEAYLAELKIALKGEPRAVIQDALADAEEHLRAALQQNAGKSETDVLRETVAAYGTPQEVAEEYRQMEVAPPGPFGAMAEPAADYKFGGFFSAIADPRAYGALLYMLLSLATGIFYFTWVVTGVSLSAGLMVLIIGVPLALLFLASVRVLAHMEGRIVETLLGIRMPRRLPLKADAALSFWERIKTMLLDIRTWTAMVYMVVQLALGIVYFTIAVTGLAVSISLILHPLVHLVSGGDMIMVGGTSDPELMELAQFINSPAGLILMVPVGVLLLFCVLNLAKIIGYLHGRFAEKVLVRL